MDRFEPNSTLIYCHGFLYNVARYKHLFSFKVLFLSSPSCRVALHEQLFEKLMSLISTIEMNCIVKAYDEKIVHSGVKAPNLAWQ